MNLDYKIKFTIGALWGSGHGQKETFIVSSSQPVDYVQKIHIKSIDLLGFDIGLLCSDYEECYISKEIYYKLQKILDWENDPEIDEAFWEEWNDEYVLQGPDELLSIWLSCLMKIDSSLKLKVVDKKDIPDFHVVKDGKNLNVPGYGLFN